jgi:hypothetical protein
VSNDSLVDIDTVRYSVPHRLVRDRVSVRVGEHDVRIYHASSLVASHVRSFEPHAIVRDSAHYAGLWRTASVMPAVASPPSLATLGRSLDEYAAVVERGGT